MRRVGVSIKGLYECLGLGAKTRIKPSRFLNPYPGQAFCVIPKGLLFFKDFKDKVEHPFAKIQMFKFVKVQYHFDIQCRGNAHEQS